MLGVSQATVSKWESGIWLPSRAMALRLSEVMSDLHQSNLSVELACLGPQQQVKALVRGRHFQLFGISAGFQKLWPETSRLLDQEIRHLLTNEAATYCKEGDYLREAIAGEILMVTGVSNRLLDVGDHVDLNQRVRWHSIVRRIDGELIHEMIYEQCEPDAATGFEKILRRSDIVTSFE